MSFQGIQKKDEVDKVWSKQDYLGGEAISETLVSALLDSSNIEYPYVSYEILDHIDVAVSRDFAPSGVVISAHEFTPRKTGTVEDTVEWIAQRAYETLGIPLEDTVYYLRVQLFVDWFVLNPDRHLNNIIFVYESGSWFTGPLFDHGQALGVSNPRVSTEHPYPHSKFKSKFLNHNFRSHGKYIQDLAESFVVDDGHLQDLVPGYELRGVSLRDTFQYRWLFRALDTFLG